MSNTDTTSNSGTIDPGHTPGSAEGTENPNDQSSREPGPANNPQDQAEGEDTDDVEAEPAASPS
ncbi:MAG: hypothetical protein JWN98_1002 [Abditibacteriota bacterium]|nr:hypothetical protein [Abditibacteriota bacterium]